MLLTDWTDEMRAHRVVVREAAPDELGWADYVDTFAVRRWPRDTRSPETLARAALETAPTAARLIVRFAWAVLGFRLGPQGSPTHILGWRILRSDPSLVEIATEGRHVTSRIIVRDTQGEIVATTFLAWQSPIIRPIWAILAPMHRRMARLLIDRVARP
jgi:hypothetical protein